MTPIVGFRAWRVATDSRILNSIVYRHSWPTHAVRASCLAIGERPPHPVPGGENCRCGLYATTRAPGVWEEYPKYPSCGRGLFGSELGMPTAETLVMGAVLMWGIVQRGERVMRGEWAQVLCLSEKPGIDLDGDAARLRSARLRGLAEEYSVPIVPFDGLTLYAAEFGDLAQ